MPERSSIGIALIAIGLGIAILGAMFWLGVLSWFGRLPGDVRIERPGFRFYAPLASMIVLSLVLTMLLWLIRRFWP
jgi:hypothetical protein